MQKTCTQCQASFEVADEDLAFYERVSPVIGDRTFPVPPPTLCPNCRQQRRLAFANRSNLYKRTSSFTGNELISIYSADKDVVVYENEVWWSDDWDPLEFGRDVDLTQPIMPQIMKVFREVPVMALMNDQNENCPYVNTTGWAKNCHLCYGADHSEDCHYGEAIYYSKNTLDTLLCETMEHCYECTDCQKCYNLQFGLNCQNCSDSKFLYDCIGCKNCFGCAGLRQQEYHYFNQKMTREEYEQAIATHLPLTKDTIAKMYAQLEELKITRPQKYIVGTNNENVTGDYISNSRNCISCFDCSDLEDCKYCSNTRGAKDFQDVNYWGHPGELCYDNIAVGEGSVRCLWCFGAWGGTENMLFCHNCIASSNCFGCSSLRHKEYCIFNKQYSKEEYESLVSKIIDAMIQNNEWGEFLPIQGSLFDYNESVADTFFPLTKEEVLQKGWRWIDPVIDVPDVEKTIPAERLPDTIDEIPDDILNWAITCHVSGKPFKMIPAELAFYRQHKLPVPHLHPDERLKKRWTYRHPRTLYARNCSKCSIEIESSYAPGRPEIVYCEKCYLSEVY